MGKSLDEILNDSEPEAEVTETEATPEQAHAEEVEELSGKKAEQKRLAEDEASNEVDDRPRDEKGRFAPKGEKQPETAGEAPPASEEETGNIPIAALKDERAKRQALEQQLAQMQQYLAQMQQPQPQQQQETTPPDRWEDPEGYDRWLMAQVTQAAEQRAIEAFNYQRIATAAAQFRADKPDYEQAIHAFGQMANQNPGLLAQMQQSPNPAEFAYTTAKQAMEIQSAGSLDAYIQQRAEQLAMERSQQVTQTAQQLPSAPPTISNSRSVGPRSGQPWQGPTPLDDLLR